MQRLCGARNRSGGMCKRFALHESLRCALHGGRSIGPTSGEGTQRSVAARVEGRRRWVERMRLAKARGEIEKIPGGRRAKGLPPLSKDPKIRKAQRFVEKAMAKLVPSDGRRAPTPGNPDIAAVNQILWQSITVRGKQGRPRRLAIYRGCACTPM